MEHGRPSTDSMHPTRQRSFPSLPAVMSVFLGSFSSLRWPPRVALASIALIFASLFGLFYILHPYGGRLSNEIVGFGGRLYPSKNQLAVRKLLVTADNTKVKQNRIGDPCSKDDIAVYQGATSPLPNGIPTYTVEIMNVCMSGCTVANIHFSCGWFSSATMVNPRIFRRIGYDDCLVNDGNPVQPGGSLSFQYANTYPYPLYVSSVVCY